MICAWKEFLAILPPWLREQVDRQGREDLQELRLRAGELPELITGRGRFALSRRIQKEDIHFCINAATRYSPWTASGASKGYITAAGGHRIGLCGEVACKDGEVHSFREIYSVNIRVARDYIGIAQKIPVFNDNILILGAPGWGKTTLLRDLCRRLAEKETVSVVDERGEIFPEGMPRGKRMDVLTGSSKAAGIDMVLRSMGPEWIAVDEITTQQDSHSLIQAVGCGVKLLSTAHASSLEDMKRRKLYQPILDFGIFSTVIVLKKDKSYDVERICK